MSVVWSVFTGMLDHCSLQYKPSWQMLDSLQNLNEHQVQLNILVTYLPKLFYLYTCTLKVANFPNGYSVLCWRPV